jgi:hypothetical protein
MLIRAFDQATAKEHLRQLKEDCAHFEAELAQRSLELLAANQRTQVSCLCLCVFLVRLPDWCCLSIEMPLVAWLRPPRARFVPRVAHRSALSIH